MRQTERVNYKTGFPEGVSPWALLRRTGRRKCPNFSKFSLLFFFRIWALLGPRKTRKKKFFESDNISDFQISDFRLSDFQTFRLSDFQSIFVESKTQKTIENFNIRPGEEKFCWDSAECPRHRCRPPPMPPLPPSPQKRVFSPQFSTSNSSEVSEFFEIVPRGKMFPWYLKINFYYLSQPSPALPGRGRARRTRGPDFCPAPLISPNILKIETWNRGYKSFIRVWDVIRYMGVDPLRSPPCPLGGKEGKSPTSFGKKKLQYLGKFQIFRHPTESKMCSSSLFPPMTTPFESTLVNWEVMSSILSHDRMKNPIFLENFNFSDFKPGCNKFYSGLRRNSLHGGRPPQKSPFAPLGEKGKSPASFGKKLQYLGKFQIFRHPTESKKCSSALFLPRLPPSKAPS